LEGSDHTEDVNRKEEIIYIYSRCDDYYIKVTNLMAFVQSTKVCQRSLCI